VSRLVVVGGGPAGLAVAIGARRQGLEVTVLDRATPPVDKPCGEGLMPDGTALLGRLGVALPGLSGTGTVPGPAPGAALDPPPVPALGEARPFRGIRYVDGDTVAEGLFSPPAHGLGIRRTVLHQAMVERAEAVGVELLWGERAVGLVDPIGSPESVSPAGSSSASGLIGVRTTAGRKLVGRWLVGADGLRSAVRGWSGLAGRAAPRARQRFGVRRHFDVEPWTDLVEVHWGEGCEAYVTPVGERTVGVAMLWSSGLVSGTAGFDTFLAQFPSLAARLSGVPVASRDRGCGPLAQRVRAVARGRIALVGDASGYLDAITGEGLSLAFHQAEALVAAIAGCERGEATDLASYTAAHRRIRRLPEALIRLLLFVERRPSLRHRMVRALAAEPEVFDRILGVHARTLRPRDLGAVTVFRLARRLIRPGVRPGGHRAPPP